VRPSYVVRRRSPGGGGRGDPDRPEVVSGRRLPPCRGRRSFGAGWADIVRPVVAPAGRMVSPKLQTTLQASMHTNQKLPPYYMNMCEVVC